MTDPSVSVVIPYSPEHTESWMLDRAVESVRDQRIKTDILVIEDGDSVAEARNIGIERATEPYVAFLDADDYWEEMKLSHQYELIRDAECAFSLTAATRDDGIMNDVAADSELEFVRKLVVGDLSTFTSSVLVDMRRTTARFDQDLYRFEEYAFALEAVHDGGYCFLNRPLTHVEKHGSGLTARENYTQKLAAKEKLFRRATELYPSLKEDKNRFYADLHYSAGRHHHFQGEFTQAHSHFQLSLQHDFRLKTVAAATLADSKMFISRIL